MANREALDEQAVVAARVRRQHLAPRLADRDGYVALFRALSPVAPIADTSPGSPPSLRFRTTFDDHAEADRRRARREIVKGRFAGGIGYVAGEDLATYAAVFRRPLAALSPVQAAVLAALEESGPLTPRQLKEETGLLSKDIGPVLQRLSESFLVFDDQVDADWERAFYSFASEWPDVDVAAPWDEAASTVILRLLDAHVAMSTAEVVDWGRLAKRPTAAVLESLAASGTIRSVTAGDRARWVRADLELSDGAVDPVVAVLHRADPLVRASSSDLAARVGKTDVLAHVLVDGVFVGAVRGHWGINPFPIADIELDLPAKVARARREEVLAAVAVAYPPELHPVLAYGGSPTPAGRPRPHAP